MLNHIWFAMILIAILIAAGSDVYNELIAPTPSGQSEQKTENRNLNEETKLGRVTSAALEGAGTAVEIAIGLIGIMALWLGVMKVAQEAGITNIIAKLVRPITRRLFPEIPEDHPAIGAMIMNIAANMLGLSNAATPLGLKAMEELDKLNPNKGEATDDMCTFLVINTSAITLIPATAIAIRASLGSANPQMIIVPSILAATCATIVGLTTVKLIQAFNRKNEIKKEKNLNRKERKENNN
jgi:spore maturation protein A